MSAVSVSGARDVREQRLQGQTVVVLGGSSGIGLATARAARAEGADVIITGRDPERLHRAGVDLGARIAALDTTAFGRLADFFEGLPPVDHLLLSGGGPYYAPFAELDFDEARRDVERHFWAPLRVARLAMGKLRPPGTLLLIGGTGGRRPSAGPLINAMTAALVGMTRSLAVELAPVRVNLIAPGFVDTPLSAALLSYDLERRRDELRATLPIHRVVGPDDVADVAVHLMTNTAVTGAIFDVDGGQQLVD